MMIRFEQVARIALALPGVEESTTNGSLAFRVRGKLFVHLWDDGDTLVIRIGREEKQVLLSADPDRFFVNRAHATSPAILTRLSDNGSLEAAAVYASGGGAIQILLTESRKDAERIAGEDPLLTAGYYRGFDIVELLPSWVGDC